MVISKVKISYQKELKPIFEQNINCYTQNEQRHEKNYDQFHKLFINKMLLN